MGQSNGRRNMWVVDSMASNDGADIVLNDTVAYSAPFAITEATQLVYRDWVLALMAAGITPSRINYPAGTTVNPIALTAFQTLYSSFGQIPRFSVRKITGGGLLTASIKTAATSASDGTYTAKAVINNTGVYSPNGIGSGGTVTIVVLGGVVTGVTPVSAGSCYNVGDTFTSTFAPGAVFKVATNSPLSYQDLTVSATINITEVIDEIPDSISINIDDDGTGHLADNIQLVIST
jgi:hypothetical protein